MKTVDKLTRQPSKIRNFEVALRPYVFNLELLLSLTNDPKLHHAVSEALEQAYTKYGRVPARILRVAIARALESYFTHADRLYKIMRELRSL